MTSTLKHNDDGRLITTDGFYLSGPYTLEREEGTEPWSANIMYTEGSSAKPTAVLLPGYRGDAIAGPNNGKLADILSNQGLSVVSLNYGGFDHYGCNGDMPQSHDPATLDTNIRDLRATMNYLGDRQVILVPSSYSINVALQHMPENVSDILTLYPFPNFVHERVQPLIENPEGFEDRGMKKVAQHCARELDERGFFVLPPFLGGHKFTAEFIKSALGHDALSDDFSDAAAHKPNITAIFMDADSVVTEGGAHRHRVPDWLGHMHRSGFRAEDFSVRGDAHELTPALSRLFAAQIRAIVNRSKIAPTADEQELPLGPYIALGND